MAAAFALAINSGKFFDIADQPGLRAWLICFFTKGAGKENSICLRRLSAGAAVWKEKATGKEYRVGMKDPLPPNTRPAACETGKEN